jgi:hypothetical protein
MATIDDLANVRAAIGVVSSGLTSLTGGTAGDPFKNGGVQFPNDLEMYNNWIEFAAVPTTGAAEGWLGGLLGAAITGSGSALAASGGVIRLPLPSNLSTDYHPTYSTPDLNAAAGMALKPFDRAIYGNKDIPGQAAAGGAFAAAGVAAVAASASGTMAAAGAAASALGIGGDAIGAALKVAGGIAMNPHKIVLFTGVDFRDHTFSWKLSPRNRGESDAIRQIIEMFTYYSHPEFVAGGLFFKYPEFFQIKFYRDSYLFKLRPSVCTNIKVDYHSQGVAAYVRETGDPTPAPVEISFSVTFKETEIISKQFLNPGINTSAAPVPRPLALEGRALTPPNMTPQILPNAREQQMPIQTIIPGGGPGALEGSGPPPPGGGNRVPPPGAERTPNRPR